MEARKLMIVEDDPAVSKVLDWSFRRAGYDVVLAENGEKALELLRSTRVDGMITDMQMPRCTGRQLCERLRAEGYVMPPFIFVVTSRSGPDERRWVESFQRAELVEKPISPRRLLKLVDSRFEKGDDPSADGNASEEGAA